MKQESEKLQYISVLRVSSMLLIVLFHSMCFYTGAWWYLCTDVVPFWKVMAPPVVKIGLTSFAFISGFLYGKMYIEKGKYRNIKLFIVNKFRRLLIPYFFWGILMIVAMPVVHIAWINLFTGVAHLWFLLMLFEIFVLMLFLNRLGICSNSTKIVDIIILVISFALIYIWTFFSNHQYALAIKETLYYLPTFLIGFYYAKYKLDSKNKFTTFLVLMIGLMALFLLSISGYPDSSTLYRIPAILVSVSATTLVKSSSVLYQSNILNNLDTNSMGIYIFNQIIVFALLIIPPTNAYLRYHSYFGVFVIFTTSLVIPWVLSNIFHRIKWLSFLIG